MYGTVLYICRVRNVKLLKDTLNSYFTCMIFYLKNIYLTKVEHKQSTCVDITVKFCTLENDSIIPMQNTNLNLNITYCVQNMT